MNLIDNAIKFTERGHVALRVLVLERQPHSARLRFEVENTGIGIAEDKLETVFQPSSSRATWPTARQAPAWGWPSAGSWCG